MWMIECTWFNNALSKELAQGETLSTKPVGVLKYKIENNLYYKIVVVPVLEELNPSDS